ncbi:DNA-methyltransferase [Taibaiella koreensis]|uniref:DNA-methyltransferase n=1 Tax=Taibaiella koreensis TaxID=1268548 RepID=UPI000E59E895|nr:site-specific DNA-methyltransferase [Taibaiella koreensis]
MNYEDFKGKVWEADCLELLPLLPDGCIDMVLCDLPYGTTQNKWDCRIDLVLLWKQYRRVIKPKGIIVLTGQGLFTGCLILSNPEWFKYKIIWIKSKATNFLNANKQPLRKHEDICVFCEGQGYYDPQKIDGLPYNKGVRKDSRSSNYGYFGAMPIINKNGQRFPSDVLFIEDMETDWIYFPTAEREGSFHSTQKPVALGRWLVRTYSRPGDIVLDNACGSGSFLVAAILEGRNFIGIDKNKNAFHMGEPVDFVAISRERIARAIEYRNRQINFK